MVVEQMYTGCLSQGAYYIESNGEVAIIDPLREVKPYIVKANEKNAKIKFIFETHFHADFVSGHVTLSERTGAPIIYGPNADPTFDAHIAKDGEEFKLGNVTIKVLHTPGHTMESTTYLLQDEEGKNHAIFTGDTLFLGDVGRPDLAQKMNEVTQEDLAGFLYDSLRNKIMPLEDNVMVYPAHGAGSACGKNMMKETVDTLGNQKKMNYALRADMSKTEFIEEVTDGLGLPPAYFPANVKLNREGYGDIMDVMEKGSKALSPNRFEEIANATHALILDVRSPEDFGAGHIPGSIFIGLDGSFAPWVGDLIIDVEKPLLLVTPEGREQETVMRLARVGFDNALGYLEGGLSAWEKSEREMDTVQSVHAENLNRKYSEIQEEIFDVRKEGEYQAEHILNGHHTPLSKLNDHLATFPRNKDFYVHCAGGYRSMIALSMLKSRGFHNGINVLGGYAALSKTDIEKTEYVCPNSIK